MRSYSFSTLLICCDVLRNLSHWIYYCKSESSTWKDPVCSQTALQETSRNISTACLITPSSWRECRRPQLLLLQGVLPRYTKLPWPGISRGSHCSISGSHPLPKALPPTEHTEFIFRDWRESSDTKWVPPNILRDSWWCSKSLLCQELIFTPDHAFWLLKAALPRPVAHPAQDSGHSLSET